MKSPRPSTAPLLLAILVLASLRPVAPVEAALDLAMAPTRLLAELALPLRWLQRGEWARADATLAEWRQAEGAAGADLMVDLRAAAEPTDSGLRLGRRLVPAEVITRNGDEAWVGLDPRVGLTGLRPGLPAVLGEAYVGRIARLDPARNRVLLDLVTGKDFFVGAVLEEEPGVSASGRPPLRMTVGGVDPASMETLLAVHNPSDRSPRPGLVRVLEPDFGGGPDVHLADGFLLGELVTPKGERSGGPWSVRPLVDFRGLSHLSLLLPRETERERDPEPLSVLRDGAWLATRPLSVGDPAPGRRGLVVSSGSLAGVPPGSAVIATTRLVGRVVPGRPVAPLSARIQLLGEPGLQLNVMARLDVDRSARRLGGFTCLGMQDGRPVFEWNSVLGLAGFPEGTRVEATLFTGAGVEGVPAGLLIGRATLGVDDGAQRVVLDSWTDGLEHRALWVRRARGDER